MKNTHRVLIDLPEGLVKEISHRAIDLGLSRKAYIERLVIESAKNK